MAIYNSPINNSLYIAKMLLLEILILSVEKVLFGENFVEIQMYKFLFLSIL